MIDLEGVSHHPTIEEIVDVLCNKTQNTDRGFFRTEVAYYLCKIAASMRAIIATKDRGEIPVNAYAIALATSGFGKGHSIHVLEDLFFSGFKRRFTDDTFGVIAEKNMWVIANQRAARNGSDQQEEYDKVEKDFRSAGPYSFTFDSGTSPAVKQLRGKLLLGNCGSINFQMDELGSNLEGNLELMNLFLELYDQGIVKDKLVKNSNDNKRIEVPDGKTPTNMLLFGTPAKLFDGGKTEDLFYSLLETGYARRCLFGLGHQNRRALYTQTPEEIYQSLTKVDNSQMVQKWNRHFHGLANPAIFGWRMDVPDDVGIKLLEYKIACERMSDQMPDHEEVRKAEMSHRYFKALKLAGAFAFVDQASEVEMDHLLSAILLVEESGAAFQQLLRREKNYVKLARFIAASETELTHADLYEELPYYKAGNAARNEMLTLASAWGYKNNIVIKKNFVDNIEFFSGETLEETDLDKMILAYSENWAYEYHPEVAKFDDLHLLTQAEGLHWVNHHMKKAHRAEENVIPGFNMIVIDVDGGISLETAAELMKDYKFLAYTTKRSTEEENRFRMIFPISYHLALDTADYKEFMNAFMNWLPFPSDEAANQRCKKWETCHKGTHLYNDGEILDPLRFIPKTSKNEQHRSSMQELQSLDNLERWFAQQISSGNRNNQMIKYALALVDGGMDLIAVGRQVHAFNAKLSDPLTPDEIESTIMVTVSKRFSRAA